MFRDRIEAGRELADQLAVDRLVGEFSVDMLLVLSVPRGGVVVGKEVAKGLGCEHDVIVAKKIGHPENEELAIGAVAEDGDPVLSSEYEALSSKEIRSQVEMARRKVKEYVEKFRGGRGLTLEGKKVVIVVDDGVATGETARASVSWLNSEFEARSPEPKVVVAVPVGARSSLEVLRAVADKVICLDVRDDLVAVGQFYENFSQVSDEEVVRLLHA